MNRSFLLLFSGGLVLAYPQVQAATVMFGAPTVRLPTAAESSDEFEEAVPPGSKIVNFFLTSDADILSISFVHAQGGALYDNTMSFANAKPVSNIVDVFPPIGADSWIRLSPTRTATILGVSLPGDGTDESTWGDTATTPATDLQNFNFAQLTFLPGSTWRFSGVVYASGATGPEAFPFDFREVPEPLGASLALCGVLGLTALRRQRRS